MNALSHRATTLTDAEKAAQALAAELYPAKSVPAPDQDEGLDDEDGDDQ